jgi:uncharacterized repeat protein (TIGR03803 family)
MKTKNKPMKTKTSMKTYIINLFLLPALIAGLGLIPAGRVTAQTFTTLHSFTYVSDGANPYAGLILSGNTLYGTAYNGGSSNYGTVFAVSTDGTGFTNLHNFAGSPSEGQWPHAGLILSGNTLYGTAYAGGSSGAGTVFGVNTNGTSFATLHNFAGYPSDGGNPYAGLIVSGNTLYGTAVTGGSSGAGTVFAVSTDGGYIPTLHSFTARNNSNYSDGANPQAGLILSGNTLYGTASQGGSSGYGTVFAVHTDGTGFTNLHSFTAAPGPLYTNSDGANPWAGLILSGNILYGTAYQGGSSGQGTVFAVSTNGTGFTNLHSFTGGSDGGNPYAGLILSGNTLYGTASVGGSSDNGTVFAVHTDGTGFTTVHSFSGRSDGGNPYAGLILSGNTLYGTTAFNGGSGNSGTVFSLFIPPLLTIIPSGANVILTWPTNAAGFTLQSTTNLISPAVWITNSPAPTVVNGQNAVTNPISGTKKFYRLSQ